MANKDQQDNDKYVTLTDEKGNESLYEILFTFHSDEYKKDYILFTPAGSDRIAVEDPDQEVEIQAFSFDPTSGDSETDSDLYPIENDDEWNMVSEVLNTFVEDDSLRTDDKNDED
ncbi:hypothetical protein AO499_05145 [Oenococcus oeni]|uniref:DUF1292 domain-containing protein n=1 Tax=Oenococcus oeni TaxID=1247 RepID=UPI000BDF3F13|nr:DUF1292 domain-containing protein [Oenococcus oeni]PDH74618.1 hypothetical protein AO499_05145 [Oenococcus oeni]